MLLAVLFTLLAWPLVVHAAARVTVPVGWLESGDAAPEAQRRASRWKDELGLRLAQVVSAPDNDRFAETIAVFERPEPVADKAFASESAALEALSAAVVNVVGSDPPEASGLRTTDAGVQVAWAQWQVEDLIYEGVLAPSGDSASIVIMTMLARDVDYHRNRLDGVIASLDGVTAPMPRFSLTWWRIGAPLVWLGLALALHAAMLRFVDQDHDHTQAGTRASVINLGLVALGTLITYFGLGDRELALVHAGSSLGGLTMWIAVSGIIVVGLHFLIAARYDRGVVQSAPASGIYSRTDMIRASVSSRSGVRPRPDNLAETSDVWAVPRDTLPDPGSSTQYAVHPGKQDER
ncbi:hypothetical protein ENSA5_52230 [Enhygromyxa salina]|uniref:Uncharacterized protein n=2 Tax=Enhygromyxa salina TaxID=215803 RepID=A0A2S9XGS0_9BACT|nr:hypothetical protein ENSA5_52230 [Enhygromyxa salina]